MDPRSGKGGFKSFLRFVDVGRGEEAIAGNSFKNVKESEIMIRILNQLKHGSSSDYEKVKVIT